MARVEVGRALSAPMSPDGDVPDYSLEDATDAPITGSDVMAASHSLSRRDRAAASLQERLSRPSPTVWLSGQEAAEYVGVSWPTLRQALIDHAIPHVRLGTLWRIEVAVLDEHLRLRRLAEVQTVQ